MKYEFVNQRKWTALGGAVLFGACLTLTIGVASAADEPAVAGKATIGTLAEVAAEPKLDPAADKVIDAFLADLEADKDITAEQRKEVTDLVAELRKEPQSQSQAMTESLRVLHSEFAEALVQLGDENADAAIPTLKKLSDGNDPYLAAEAKFYLARTHIMKEDFEQALPVLDELVGEKYAGKFLSAGESLFLKGIAQARLLKRSEAQASLTKFLEENPNAPERLIVGAKHQLLELEYTDEGSIVDVQDRMDYSRRRLTLERSDEPTQTEQGKIIAMLDKLIEEAEQKECDCRGGGNGSGSGKGSKPGGKGGQNPAGGAEQSTAPVGESKVGSLDRVNRGKMGDQWGGLRDKQREEVLSALKAKFPNRYKQLVEQYYKSLQEEE